ncbi:MAG TPA: serine/threonine-protein kinase [Polyangiaceae bacterium]|nr:serine/threonine-protein kinase [Polyangiaceae bacterium]
MTHLQMDPLALVGTTLAGKYAIEHLVSETQLSLVYRASHRVWRRPVAIKAFKAPMLGDGAREQMLDGFVREGVLLMDLSERCAAICQARDVSSTITASGDWVPYMVLEWLEGEPLESVLARERWTRAMPRSVAQTVSLLNPIAKALALAHERLIVHGDVKPGNIFLLTERTGTGPRSKLLDFGIARVLGVAGAGATSTPLVMKSFTPAYGAPEQFSSRYGSTGPWTDVFALALICVEMLTGREPLRGATLEEIEGEACNPHVRPTPRALGAPVSDGIERVMAQALAVSPVDRYATARDFWLALRRAARDVEGPRQDPPGDLSRVDAAADSSGAMPVALTRRRARPARRWLAAAIALACAGAALGALQRSPWISTARAHAWARVHVCEAAMSERAAHLRANVLRHHR